MKRGDIAQRRTAGILVRVGDLNANLWKRLVLQVGPDLAAGDVVDAIWSCGRTRASTIIAPAKVGSRLSPVTLLYTYGGIFGKVGSSGVIGCEL